MRLQAHQARHRRYLPIHPRSDVRQVREHIYTNMSAGCRDTEKDSSGFQPVQGLEPGMVLRFLKRKGWYRRSSAQLHVLFTEGKTCAWGQARGAFLTDRDGMKQYIV